MTKKILVVMVVLTAMLISFSLVLATQKTGFTGTPDKFAKQTLANKQVATRMPKETLTQKQTATSVYPVGRANPPATRIPFSAPQACRLQHDNGNGASYFSGWSVDDQQAVYYDPATMCTGCDTVYLLEVTQVEGVFYDHAGAGDLDVIFHFYEAGDVCTGPGVEIYSFEATITTFYPDVAVVSVPDLLCLEDDFFLACEYNSGITGEIPCLLADDNPPVDTCFQWNEYLNLGWIEWFDFWAAPHPGWLMLRAVGTCDAEDCYQGEECNMMQGSGAPASYFGSWNVGDRVAKYYDPEEYCAAPTYPCKISAVEVALFDFAGVESSDIRIAIYRKGGDPCDGPGIEIYHTDPITVTEFYPSITHVDLSDVVCLYEPFFVAVKYASGIPGEIPSVLFDDGSVPMDTCHAWVYWWDDLTWIEWNDFWATPIPGVPMIYVEAYTESPLCSGEILPGQGLRFYQLDLTYPGATQLNSRYGLAVVDFDSLLATTGIGMGYLNITTPQGWVVRNMPVDTSSGYPGLSAMFDLGDTVDINSLLVYAHISEDPLFDFSAIPNVLFDVGTRENNAQGSDSPRPAPPGNPVDVTVVEFELGGLIDAVWQPGHPNVEQDDNQCGPAAVANSLKWLDDKYEGITVPHEHRPGIRDNSLPGELDQDMEREAHEPVTSAKNFLRGKLEYIDDNEGLKGKLDIKHKSRPGITWLPDDETVGGTTSEVDTTDTSLVEWLINELKAGEDVEVRIGWDGGGGHYIDLIGGGHVLGAPWIAWVHDADQGYVGNNVDENGGVSLGDGGIGHSWVEDNKIVCYIEGEYFTGTIDYAVSESPKPGPGSEEGEVPFYHGLQRTSNFGAIGNDNSTENFVWYDTNYLYDGTFVSTVPVEPYVEHIALDVYDCEQVGFIPTQPLDVYYDPKYNANIAYANFYTEEDVISCEYDSLFVVGIMDSCVDFSLKIKIYYNPTGTPIPELYAGLFEDWNVGDSTNNWVNMDTLHNLMWMYEMGNPYMVFGMMKAPFYDEPMHSMITINNPTEIDPNGGFCDDAAGWHGLDSLFVLMTSPNPHYRSSSYFDRYDDYSMLMVPPPFSLNPGEKHLELWIDFGRDLSDGVTWEQWWYRVLRYAGFYRGDVNSPNYGEDPEPPNSSDLVYLINYLFVNGPAPLPYPDQGDVNADGNVNSADVAYLINYLFVNGPAPIDYVRFIPQKWTRPSLFTNPLWR